MNFKNKNIILLSLLMFCFNLIESKQNDTYLTEQIAIGNDLLIHKGETKPFLKPVTSLTSRAMSVTLLPICLGIDMAILTAKQAQELPFIILNKNSSKHKAQYQRNNQVLKSKSLALLTAPMGIISPDIVSHHFVPNTATSYKLTPYGKLYSVKAHVIYPESAEEIQLIVNEARLSGKSVSVIGKFMSQGKQAISNKNWNITINTSKLNQILIDPKLKIAKVGAGVSWGELQKEANKFGLAIRVMQASNIFSIGGSLSANCHGWDYKSGCLRNTIMAITIVDANGKIIELSPEDPLFDCIIGGYGGFGVIVDATISLTNNTKLIEKGIEIDPNNYVDYFNEIIRNNKNIEMHLYRLSLEPKHLFKSGIAVNYYITDDEPLIANLIDEPKRGSRMDRIKLHTIRRIPSIRNIAWNLEKKDALGIKTLSRNEIMRPPINLVLNNSKIDSEWLQEYFVKAEDLSDFIVFLGKILQKNNVALLNASVRYVKTDSKTMLSYAKNGDRFAVVLFFNQKLCPKEIIKTKIWVRKVIDYLIAHDGSFYLPYQHFATKEQFQACYPNWKKIVTLKNSIDPLNVFNNGFYTDYLSENVNENSLYRKVFNRVHGQRKEILDFLNNVFMQLDTKKFFILMDYILENPNLNDEEIYKTLHKKIHISKSNVISNINQTLKSLKHLKKDLAIQTAHLINQKQINGYVEIGYPGRMINSLKDHIQMKGPFYAITEKESLTDYIESGFPRPYHYFIPLNDYEPISESSIPTASVDLVCIYIGLHHAPKEKLNSFIESIKRILRPGGTFILMDHDAHTAELKNVVNVVHSIFNAATGVDPELNKIEIRDFHSLKYWINLLESYGMIYYQHEPLVRKGDSTLNSLIRFNTPSQKQDMKSIESSLLTKKNYSRTQKQTYLTAPEWQNVRASQRYSAFLKNNSAHNYPFFNEIGDFWKVYYQSLKASQRESSFLDVMSSEYNLMNIFIGTTMTLEYGIKGVLSTPFAFYDKAFCKKNYREISPTDKERQRALVNYGKYIEHTPFYNYPYFKDIQSYWKIYLRKNKCFKSLFKGGILGLGMTFENTLKGIVSFPMSFFYGSETVKEPETIQLLIIDKENIIEMLDSNIKVLENYPELSVKHIEVPRYLPFTQIMQRLAKETSIECVNIAGNYNIQVDVTYSQKNLPIHPGMKKIYDFPSAKNSKSHSAALNVKVDCLFDVIRTLEKNNINTIFIHDF